MNLYRYVGNGPMRFVDPRGLDYTVPSSGGTLVYPGNSEQGVAAPPNLVTSQTMQDVDAPVQSGTGSLSYVAGASIAIGYLTGTGPIVTTYARRKTGPCRVG